MPISISDASHTTSKTLEKSGRCMTSLLTILFLISTNVRDNVRPTEFTLLQIVGDWAHDDAKPFDEPTIEGSEPLKTSHITDGLGLRSFLNGSYILGFRSNSISKTTNPRN